MKAKDIYLYIDESGNFNNDSKGDDNPSLVGGILTMDQEIDFEYAKNLCGGKELHSVDENPREYAKKAIPLLKLYRNNGWKLVIFENKERLEIVDGDTTYLNIISEGLIQLLHILKSRFQEVMLHVVVAVRKPVNRVDYGSDNRIDEKQYIDRLKEKIIIGLARKSISNISLDNFEITFRSARVGNYYTDYRLMLADVVCHSWFRKNRKFNGEEKILECLYNPDWIFPVFPKPFEEAIRNHLINANFSEVLFDILTSSEIEHATISKSLRDLFERIENSNEITKVLTFRILFSKIMNLYHIDLDYNFTMRIVDRAKLYLLNDSNFIGNVPTSFIMDIGLLSATIYTHRGDVMGAEDEMVLCEHLLPKLVNRWESLDYYFLFKIRQGIHLLNKYEVHRCIEEMDMLEDMIDNTLGLFPLADGFNELCSEIKSDIKGKVLGTRLQARLYLINEYPEQLNQARWDSDAAIAEFDKDIDKNRQYQYRCRIEYESGNHINALHWLEKSIGVNNHMDFDQILVNIKNMYPDAAAFSVLHYINIMLIAMRNREASTYNLMKKKWGEHRGTEFINELKVSKHPMEIIYWKLATLLMNEGSITAASDRYDSACKICDIEPRNLTLKAISLAIRAERVALLSKAGRDGKVFKESERALVKVFKELMGGNLPEKMHERFMTINEMIHEIETKGKITNSEKLLKWSQQIIY